MNETVLYWLLVFLGTFYAGTGLWPLIHIESFMKVTGPKKDLWLVRTVGMLVTVSGLVYLSAAFSNRITSEILLLAVGNALALAVIDIVYVIRGVISRIYLLDGFAELLVAGTIGLSFVMGR